MGSRVRPPVNIVHLVPGVDAGAPQTLQDEHKRALESISHAAAAYSNSELKLRVVVVCDDTWPAIGLPGLEIFRKSIDHFSLNDGGGIRPKLRSFFPSELLSEDQTLIFSNADICVAPEFYNVVADLVQGGTLAGSIHRRTVLGIDASRPENLEALTRSKNWYLHPGSDCFFFPAENAAAFVDSEVMLGVPPVGRLMVLVLSALNPSFRKFPDSGLTFHFGDDRVWQKSDSLRKLEKLNRRNWFLSLPKVLSMSGARGFMRGMNTIGIAGPRKWSRFLVQAIGSLVWVSKP
jgi:hypothetical protein